MTEESQEPQQPRPDESTPRGAPTARGEGRPPLEPSSFPPPPPPTGYPPVMMAPPPPPRWSFLGRLARRALVMLLVLSILLNLVLLAGSSEMAGGGVRETTYASGDATRRIVILPIEGIIDDAKAEFVQDALAHLRASKPAAIVLRVDSPGGTVSAADRIWHELSQFKEEQKIPLVASYAGQAASGGYYVSALSDKIIAEPTCITGSVGVIMTAFSVEGLLQKVGVTPQILIAQGSELKDTGSMFRAWTEKDKQIMQKILDTMYDRFVGVVAKGRSMTDEQARAAADGAPLTVPQAIERHLVDQEGFLEDALGAAKELAKIPADVTPKVTTLHPRQPFDLWSILGVQRADSADFLAETFTRAATRAQSPVPQYLAWP
ncbi:MAG: signal peptide peptidase SppA [Phycisphaeraceae bacterium]|nr:signal peptide peptidase SppA [Phycisphaeraceae bacterium]